MIINKVIYDCKTGETMTKEIEVEDIIQEIPIQQEVTLEDRVTELEMINQQQDELINITMLATDEMFMMLEPLLMQTVTLQEGGDSKMVDMYVAMVQRGLKTIDQVPARYREQVREILIQLEG